MQKAPVMKGSGLAPIEDEPVHVFGRNLEERVVAREVEEDEDARKETEDAQDRRPEDDVEAIKKRKFDAITGEENEVTAFQGEFKLFVWDFSTSNWIEKGRGQLKLNDYLTEKRSRLIMRAGGTFRIILNVAIRHSLFKVITITKTSIRFTDSQNVWAASGSNAKQLGDFINDRISEAAEESQTTQGPVQGTKDQGDAPSQSGSNENKTTPPIERDDTSHPNDNDASAENEEVEYESKTEPAEEVRREEESRRSQDDSSEDGKQVEEEEKQDSEDNEPESAQEPTSEKHSEQVSKNKTAVETTGTAEQDSGNIEEHGRDETKRLKLSSD